MISSYPSIYNLGHKAIADLLNHPVIVEEKVDGSQFSFYKDAFTGTVFCRSKGSQINMAAPEKMFARAVATVIELAPLLTPGYEYRGEYLNSPKHNCLCYDHVPVKHIILFDVSTGGENYLSPEEKWAEANRLGLECVPMLFRGVVDGVNHFRALLETQSVLGGQKIEGVVIKPEGYNLFGIDKKVLLGKFVSESFREVHSKTWDREYKTPGSGDILAILKAKYGTHARWNKAIIHLAESGLITDSPTDIGLVMKEVPEDVLKECKEEICADLFTWAWPQLRRALTSGFPEFYKEELLKKQFTITSTQSPEIHEQ
jgi:hypothetical protein